VPWVRLNKATLCPQCFVGGEKMLIGKRKRGREREREREREKWV